MQHIDFTTTFALINSFIDKYNQDPNYYFKKVSDKELIEVPDFLKSQHVQTMQAIIKMYAAQLNKGFQTKIDCSLPIFSSNNVAIGKYIRRDPRTVRRYLSKLVDCGMITKVFHGTSHNFDVVINPELLFIPYQLTADQLQNRIDHESSKELADRILLNCKRTNRPLKDTSTFSNKLIRLVDKPDGLQKEIKTSNTGKQDGITKRNSIFKRSICPQTKEAGEQRAEPRENLVPRLDKVTGEALTPIFLMVQNIWRLCLLNLYSRIEYLTPNQIEYAYTHFYKELEPLTISERENYYNEIRVRIFAASIWLKKDINRFIPVPSVYFDPDNDRGFSKTKSWYDDMQNTTNQIKQFKKLHPRTQKKYEQYLQHHKALMDVGTSYIYTEKNQFSKRTKTNSLSGQKTA